jgi:hypothetical protein
MAGHYFLVSWSQGDETDSDSFCIGLYSGVEGSEILDYSFVVDNDDDATHRAVQAAIAAFRQEYRLPADTRIEWDV